MKLNALRVKVLGQLTIVLVLSGILAGCGSNPEPDPVALAQTRERERLLAENEGLEQARTENEEVQRLKKENQELPKIRSQYQEAARLTKENEQLRQQVAKLTPAASVTPAGSAAPNIQGANVPPVVEQGTEQGEEIAVVEGELHEGDDILVEPKYLKQLLPDFDWDKMERKEPLAIRALLERGGLELTNASQLKEFGITNFVIRRALPPDQQQLPAEQPR